MQNLILRKKNNNLQDNLRCLKKLDTHRPTLKQWLNRKKISKEGKLGTLGRKKIHGKKNTDEYKRLSFSSRVLYYV